MGLAGARAVLAREFVSTGCCFGWRSRRSQHQEPNAVGIARLGEAILWPEPKRTTAAILPNPTVATYGFGVVLSDEAMSAIADLDRRSTPRPSVTVRE